MVKRFSGLALATSAALACLSTACTQWNFWDHAVGRKAYEYSSTLEWHTVEPGDVFMSTGLDIGSDGLRCASGYFGAQFHSDGSTWLFFSMAGNQMQQTLPVGPYCIPDCFDCAGPPFKDVQCKRNLELKTGVKYHFLMQMLMQNASGAMWGAEVIDTSSGNTILEIGRMFIIDAPLGLEPSKCRTLTIRSYSFQEYYNPFKAFTTEASWSRAQFSGEMVPLQEMGSCAGQQLKSIEDENLADCKQSCVDDLECAFASYTIGEDQDYAIGGRHCALFKQKDCETTNPSTIWTTFTKQPELPVSTGVCGDGGPLAEFKEGISLGQCMDKCKEDSRCKFASYTSTDFMYETDGKHCYLYTSCSKFSSYLADLWTTYSKKQAMEPMAGTPAHPESTGVCGDEGPLAEFKEGISREQCMDKCREDSRCKFASYTSIDTLYTTDGTHCMLYTSCSKFSSYLADLWTTYSKKQEQMMEPTGGTARSVYPLSRAEECCASYDGGKTKSVITSMSPLSMRFSSGPNVQCEEKIPSQSTLYYWQIHLLNQHNLYRCIHNVPAYSWDVDLAASAQAYANKGVWGHSGTPGVGENLQAGGLGEDPKSVAGSWYAEISGSSPYGICDPLINLRGHYTQVVWKDSVKLGCGYSQTDHGDADYYVCQYSPAGNVQGLYPENVLRAQKSVTACGGTAVDVPPDFPPLAISTDLVV